MNGTTGIEFKPEDRRTVDTNGLQQILGVGRQTATEIGTAAGARIQVGRRVLWDIRKIDRHLQNLSKGGDENERTETE